MTLYTRRLVYPEGDTQEITHSLRINQLIDINGNPLHLPLLTDRMIVYRVYKMSTDILIGEEITNYHLELIRRDELTELT